MRRLLPAGFVLALVMAVLFAVGASSEPVTGIKVPTVAQFNALDARVTTLESKVAALEATPAPSPTPEPSTSPSPTPTASPTQPTPAPATTGAFPDADSTGPTGTLTNTSGDPWINTAGTIIENRRHTGTIQVAAANVIIRNSHIIGNIVVVEGQGASVTVLDTLVDNGTNFNSAGLGGNNITVKRTEIVGGGHSFSCKWDCDIQDNWFHAQANPSSGDVHGDGILFNAADNMIVRHNTLACDMPADGNGACSAGLAMYGDWDPITDVLVEGNLFKASPAGYCMYGGNVPSKPYGASNVDVINNVFERGSSGQCAVYGPATAAATDAASSWSGNTYTDGTPVARP